MKSINGPVFCGRRVGARGQQKLAVEVARMRGFATSTPGAARSFANGEADADVLVYGIAAMGVAPRDERPFHAEGPSSPHARSDEPPRGRCQGLDLVSIVAPCYNEEGVLAEFQRRVTAVCRSLRVRYEIVLIDDGSTDRTWDLMEQFASSDPHVVAISLSRNHGHQIALMAGLNVCRGQRIMIIDADLQDPPELLPEMLRRMDDGVDVVYGKRLRRDGETRFKRLTAYLFYRLIDRLTDIPIQLDAGDFRLMSRRVLDVLLAMPERHKFLRGMVSWAGFRQEPIHYDRQTRFAGYSKYSLRKMMRFACDAIATSSVRPLALSSWAGLITGIFALLLVATSLVALVRGRPVTIGSVLLIAVLLLGSVQLSVLGILGEYVGRLFEQAKGRPLFVIDRIHRSSVVDGDLDSGIPTGGVDSHGTSNGT
jgi:polyisoprenyl-phosphate glycosyltransferase